jgi:REP element-mobilizing transposase RayT
VPRPLRVEFPGASFHVINRGNYRRELFLGKGAAEAFERVLGEAARSASPAEAGKTRQVLTLDIRVSCDCQSQLCQDHCEWSLQVAATM